MKNCSLNDSKSRIRPQNEIYSHFHDTECLSPTILETDNGLDGIHAELLKSFESTFNRASGLGTVYNLPNLQV